MFNFDNKRERNEVFVGGVILCLVVGVFFGGILFSGSDKNQEVKEQAKVDTELIEKSKLKEKEEKIEELESKLNEYENREDIWQELKSVDDNGFKVAGEGFFIVSDMFGALKNGNLSKFQVLAQELKDGSEKMDSVVDKRQEILGRLGY